MALAATVRPKLSEILRRLMFERDIRTIDLARLTNLPQPTVQRMVTGYSPNPHLSSLIPIAEFFKISIDQLRGIEPIAWHNFKTTSHTGLTKIPILSWQEVPDWNVAKQDFSMTTHTPGIFMEENPGKYAFALYMQDSSMTPLFPKGTLLIIDPDKPVKDRSYAVVSIKNHPEPIFRQLLLDANKKYLKALSPDLEQFPMIALKEDDAICGTLVQTRRNFED